MAENEQKPTIVDDPSAIEIYVNKIVGSSFDGATVGVTLGCVRVVPERLDISPSRPAAVYVAGRLSLKPSAAAELVNGLSGILTAISKGSSKTN